MATLVAGGAVQQGSTGVSIFFGLRNISDFLETTGKVAADMTIRYARPLSAPVTVTPVNLAAVTTGWTSGGVIALDNSNMRGQYRLDLPDAAFAIGASLVVVTVTVAGCWVEDREIPLTPVDLPWTLSATVLTTIADTLLRRDMGAVTGEASRSPLNALRRLRNRWIISGTTNTIMKEDDATPAFQESLSTSSSATPVTGADPT